MYFLKKKKILKHGFRYLGGSIYEVLTYVKYYYDTRV